MSDTFLDQAVLLLVSGLTREAAEEAAITRGGLTTRKARAIVKKAHERITLAADYSRRAETGRAVMRLNDIYARSVKNGDTRTALSAQRELNRLLGLDTNQPDTDENPVDDQLQKIAAHLIPLGLAPETYPLHEHARIAADRIRQTEEVAS